MNMSNTRWLYVARHQWGGGSNTSRTAGNDAARGNKGQMKMWKHGESAKEKWGGEESLKKGGKPEKRALKQSTNR
jgi:hypothetical protein